MIRLCGNIFTSAICARAMKPNLLTTFAALCLAPRSGDDLLRLIHGSVFFDDRFFSVDYRVVKELCLRPERADCHDGNVLVVQLPVERAAVAQNERLACRVDADIGHRLTGGDGGDVDNLRAGVHVGNVSWHIAMSASQLRSTMLRFWESGVSQAA